MKTITALALILSLTACAGSARHTVPQTTVNPALTCQQIKTELDKLDKLEAAIKKDKATTDGRDVIDGVLFFPFNLMVKAGNYSAAEKAAKTRRAELENLEKSKHCK